MKVLNLLASGGTGGIEALCRDIIIKSDFDNRICFLFEDGEIYEELKEKKCKVFSLKGLSRKQDKIVNKLVEYCTKEKIDIVVVHHGGIKCNLIYIELHKKLPNIKYVRYLHGSFDRYSFGNGENFIKDIIVKNVMKKAFKISDLLIFISNAVKESFEISFDLSKNKTTVIYNGIEKRFFENQKNRKDNQIMNIIFVGRLARVKGVDLLVNAFASVNKSYLNTRLTIIGDGEERKKLEAMSKKLGIENKVFFEGRQKDVIKWLDAADIFVYPSIWEEGFGISVVEAMARGCIPITFRKGGLPEIIKNNQSGFLIDEVNSKILYQKMKDIIKMEDKEKIINNAIATSKKFTIKNTIENLEQQYEKLQRS